MFFGVQVFSGFRCFRVQVFFGVQVFFRGLVFRV